MSLSFHCWCFPRYNSERVLFLMFCGCGSHPKVLKEQYDIRSEHSCEGCVVEERHSEVGNGWRYGATSAFGTDRSSYSYNNHQNRGSSWYKTDINTRTAMPKSGTEPADVHAVC